MALNDEEVQKQIKHMMAFIDQEADEKADEIDAKAEEEFNIEKGRLVQQQRLKLMELFGRKEKQIDLQKKIQNSNTLNQSRLKLLKCRDEYVKTMINDARSRLTELLKDRNKYKGILEGLIVQALLQLLENNVLIHCRKEDCDLVKEVIPMAIKLYKEKTGQSTNITLDSNEFLRESSLGGVEVIGLQGRIKVVNTMNSRLEMIYQQMLPEIRVILFGQNSNRRFFD